MAGDNDTPAPRARLRWPGRLALAVIVAVTALELGLRVAEPEEVTSRPVGGDVGTDHGLYRPHPYMGYTLRPLAGGQGTNLLGLRAGRVTTLKAPGTYRIVCLGGSTTFGSGLAPEETYPARLAEILADLPDRTDEVVNAGVPGYTTAESLIHLALRLADLDPDAIVVYHGVNDARVIQARGFLSDYSHLRRSWSERRVGAFQRWLLDNSAAWRALTRELGLSQPASRLEHVLFVDDYKQRYLSPHEHGVNAAGVAAFGRNLEHIVALARARDVEVALMTFAWCAARILPDRQQDLGPTMAALNAELEAVAARLEVPVLRMEGALQNKDDLFQDFVHVNAEGARRQALAMARQGRELGLWGL